MDDEQTLMESLRKSRDTVAKARLPVAARSALQKTVDLAIADAQLLVALRERLQRDLEAHESMPEPDPAWRRQLVDASRALKARHASLLPHHRAALDALTAAGGVGDPALAGVTRLLGAMGRRLFERTPALQAT